MDGHLSAEFDDLTLSNYLRHNKSDKYKEDAKKRKKAERSLDFDEIVGHIEDMLLDARFYRLQEKFLEEHWSEFDYSEENKHSYMEIFINYTNTIEGFIVDYLQLQIPQFAMDNFIHEVERRKHELDGEVFEILFTLTDFTAFKEMFLDYKKMKENGEMDLSSALSIVQVNEKRI